MLAASLPSAWPTRFPATLSCGNDLTQAFNTGLLVVSTLISQFADSPLRTVTMTVLLPYGRTLPKQLATRSGILTRLVSTARVARPQAQSRPSKENPDGSHTSYLAFGASRSYATAAGRPASKPKAHTGRTTAKGTTKKTATKPKAQPKKSTKAKPKPKPKANPKPKVKKAPSASVLKREATQKRVSRKEMGLLRKEPKQLPERAWTVFCQQAGAPKGESVTSRMSAVGVRFKQISPEEREVCPLSMYHCAS